MTKDKYEDRLQEISRKLDIIIYLISVHVPREGDKKDEILNLASLGFNRHEIALMLNTTPGAVSVVISQNKKPAKSGKESAASSD